MINYTYEWVRSTFIELTKKTYPYGHEDEIASFIINNFENRLEKDTHGNFYIKIGESKTMFTSHFDTAGRNYCEVNHIFDGDYIKTDGKSILGADDKAGVTIMLYMIKNDVPGLYYFFIGEEVGCVGSSIMVKYGDIEGKYDRVVSFDRRGTRSIITHQSQSRTSSDKFANSLAKELNKLGLSYEKDDTGIYTDSAEFSEIVPECTNISVGYYSEHTFNEKQDILHLSKLADACLLVNWDKLPVDRNPRIVEYKKYESRYTDNFTHKKNKKKNRKRCNSRYDDKSFEDDDFDEWVSNIRNNQKVTKRYYDGVELTNFDNNYSVVTRRNGKYEPLKSKFLYSKMSSDELDIVKKQASEFMV